MSIALEDVEVILGLPIDDKVLVRLNAVEDRDWRQLCAELLGFGVLTNDNKTLVGPINTDNQLAIFESVNAWTEKPKHIMQKYGVIFTGGYGTIKHLGNRILINVCH